MYAMQCGSLEAISPQMGGVYCFTALHLYTPPNAGSCEHEGASAALSDGCW